MLVILITALVIVLIFSQLLLARKQIKKGAPDGRILLIINICTLIIFLPVAILKLIFNQLVINIIWYIVAALYMIFTLWYTNNLKKGY